jgi:hypothetical protein
VSHTKLAQYRNDTRAFGLPYLSRQGDSVRRSVGFDGLRHDKLSPSDEAWPADQAQD